MSDLRLHAAALTQGVSAASNAVCESGGPCLTSDTPWFQNPVTKANQLRTCLQSQLTGRGRGCSFSKHSEFLRSNTLLPQLWNSAATPTSQTPRSRTQQRTDGPVCSSPSVSLSRSTAGYSSRQKVHFYVYISIQRWEACCKQCSCNASFSSSSCDVRLE